MIPPEIELTETAEMRLANYLDREIYTARSERDAFISKLARLKEKYRSKFPEFPKDWPIAGASQLVVPVIKTAIHTLGARIYQTVMAAESNLASVRVIDQDWQDFANDYEKFLDIYSDERLDMPSVLDGWTTELIKLGTAVLEVTTKLDRRAVVDYDQSGMKYTKRTVDFYNGPIVYHVPLEDFWIRPAHKDPDEAPWCGKEIRLAWSKIKDMALSGELNPDKIDRIWQYMGETELTIPKTVTKQE
jgi:hypothetical protein